MWQGVIPEAYLLSCALSEDDSYGQAYSCTWKPYNGNEDFLAQLTFLALALALQA